MSVVRRNIFNNSITPTIFEKNKTFMRNFILLSISFIIIALASISCHKDLIYEGKDATLRFSMDTVSFDTVISTLGTSTKRLMIYNPYSKKINISSIELGGENSPFVVNINGIDINKAYDVEISANDSLYVFVQVDTALTKQNTPLVLLDSLIFTVNGNIQNVKLLAYSQDVNLIKSKTLKTTTWNADKPYLLLGDITIDSLETLTISKGTTVYFHKNANLLVKGTLKVLGEFGKPVTFRGDRLEKEYNDYPGQWGSIALLPGSKDHSINWLVAANGTSGIILGAPNDVSKPNLEVSNSIIRNNASTSLLVYNAKIKVVNCVIANASIYACALLGNGTYEFYHCTIANYYGGYDRRNSDRFSVYMSNNKINDAKAPMEEFSANFYNSIIYGNGIDELVIDSVPSLAFNLKFNNCLIRSRKYDNSKLGSFTNTVWNSNPKFKSPDEFNYQLDTLSSARNKGDIEIGILYPKDLNNNDRTITVPDIGAYERIEK